MRHARLAALLALGLLAAACGPAGPTDSGGEPVDARSVADALPSPAPLVPEGGARAVDASGLAEASFGSEDAEVAERLAASDLRSAAVREWSAPGGSGMTVSVSVWGSAVVARSFAGSTAEQLLGEPDAVAWTARGIPGSRGARIPDGAHSIGKAVGPNALVVSAGPGVSQDIVVQALRRLITVAEAQGA